MLCFIIRLIFRPHRKPVQKWVAQQYVTMESHTMLWISTESKYLQIWNSVTYRLHGNAIIHYWSPRRMEMWPNCKEYVLITKNGIWLGAEVQIREIWQRTHVMPNMNLVQWKFIKMVAMTPVIFTEVQPCPISSSPLHLTKLQRSLPVIVSQDCCMFDQLC